MRRVLRHAGHVALVDYAPRGPFPRLADRLIRLYDHGHRRSYDAPEQQALLRHAGFDLVPCRRFYIGPLMRGVVTVAARPAGPSAEL